MKKRVLFWGDFACSTGFAQVSQNIMQRLYATGDYDIDIVGINFSGEPDGFRKFPYYTLYPAVVALSQDPDLKSPYGFKRFLMQAASGQYDIIFMLNDTFIVNVVMPSLLEIQAKMPKEHRFATVLYFPVDSPLHEGWVKNVVAKADFPVVYTNYGKRECLLHAPELEKKLRVVYHGVDKSTFYPMPPEDIKEFRKQFFAQHADKYIVLNVARNQPRKDLHRSFAAFKLFHDKYPNSIYFILAQAEDVGGNLVEIARRYGLEWDRDWICPRPGTYGANQGVPVEVVNKIYNASDLVISTTLGEGWGLSSSEGMATMTPLLFPKNTSLVEIIGENEERGYFCSSGKDLDHMVCLGSPDNNQVRPTVDAYDMAQVMEHIYLNPEEAQAKAARAFSEVWTWDQVCEIWKTVFHQASKKVDVLRGTIEVGRNDPCPCGSGEKYKHCCL